MIQDFLNIDFSSPYAGFELFALIASYALLVLVALPVHEFAHAFAAYKLGDNTAKWQGRLTLNPFKHLDIFGTVMLVLCGIGYAKPVPVTPYYFRNPKRGMAITSFAGPLSNLAMAVLALVLYRLGMFIPVIGQLSAIILSMLDILLINFAGINIGLAVFNLLPIPPLDGSNIFAAILPDKWIYTMNKYQQYISIGLFVLLLTGALNVPLAFLRWAFGFVICGALGMDNIFLYPFN